ncbi:GNAT family N-acetyltransferase [Tumebacillus sp. ITR2]|uniref:GNAT family N-acetyltransferase n=1 Tax=Tumebacillus amylolyticus TaxID=2801339 RepID=A0ABS1JCW3_9BACL|nr:GNAT family protein [Tumebacillus amylolyticus]MBL0388083.1 GNAT family N-acetyltransferase [Tumebacillus amylolyticus]
MTSEQTFELRTGQTLTLRQAHPDDAEAILDYIHLVSGESDNLSFGVGEFTTTLEKQKQVLEQWSANGGLYLLALVDGEIASTLTFETGSRPRNEHKGEFGITVQKKFWNLGIATKMLSYMIDWAKLVPRIRKINLHVRTDNDRAIALYEKLGFQHEGRETRSMQIHGQFFDTYLMGLPLD